MVSTPGIPLDDPCEEAVVDGRDVESPEAEGGFVGAPAATWLGLVATTGCPPSETGDFCLTATIGGWAWGGGEACNALGEITWVWRVAIPELVGFGAEAVILEEVALGVSLPA